MLFKKQILGFQTISLMLAHIAWDHIFENQLYGIVSGSLIKNQTTENFNYSRGRKFPKTLYEVKVYYVLYSFTE